MGLRPRTVAVVLPLFALAASVLYLLVSAGVPGNRPGAAGWATEGPVFTDVAPVAGVAHLHTAPSLRGEPPGEGPINGLDKLGSGAALGDYDGDGWTDIYVNDGGGTGVLYRNLGNGTFRDVTREAGLENRGDGRGAAWGDYDNDGCPDLYVAYLKSPNRLYHNNCNGTFTEVGRATGVDYNGTTHSVLWFDYNRDGLLDLYLVNYGDVASDPPHSMNNSRNGKGNILYRNNGNGTFTDVTAEVGVGDAGWGLAAVASDLIGDGWPDLYVANDFGPNVFYRNVGGRFQEDANRSGLAYRGNGMSADTGDIDNSGNLSLYVPNIYFLSAFAGTNPASFEEEKAFEEGMRRVLFPADSSLPAPSTSGYLRGIPPTPEMVTEASVLFVNRGNGTFRDEARERGVHQVEWGWSALFFDADNDGWLDIFATNGFKLEPSFRDLPARFFHNRGDGAFREAAKQVGLDDKRGGTGAALADFDHTGNLGIYVVNYLEKAALYINKGNNHRHWFIVKLEGACGPGGKPRWPLPQGMGTAPCSNRDAVGALAIRVAGKLTQTREVKAGSGYLSMSDLPLHFGLADAGRVERLEIRWPSGLVQVVESIPADQAIRVREGLQAWERLY